MEHNELFTLETLGEFYTDAAKAGGMQLWHSSTGEWLPACGPNLASSVLDWRLKPAQPIVRWLVRFEDKTPYPKVFDTEREALMFEANNICWPRAKIIKLVEEQS